MAHDRTGERVETEYRCGCRQPGCPCRDPRCRRGWLTPPDADNPVPCRICKPKLYEFEKEYE